MKKNKTVAEILKSCKLNDILIADKGQQWKVVDLNYDVGGLVVATPYKWQDKKIKPFELWSSGVERSA
jgi:hypothetical protein